MDMEEDVHEGSDLLHINFVDCSWDPLGSNDIDDDEGWYLGRLYKNGQVYNDMEFGQIRLKSWMFFVDKDRRT